MIAVMVGDEDTVNVFRCEVQSRKALLQLCAAETLVNKHLDMGCFQQGRVASTPCPKVCDRQRHANIKHASREILEHTD